MKFFDPHQVDNALDRNRLIENLKTAFAGQVEVPQRQHLTVDLPNHQLRNILLIMPAWESERFLGVKIVSIAPENAKFELPAILGSYLLFDVRTGEPLATMDAKLLTARRTAATSALASTFLSKRDSQSMLMIGTGALAPELIQAHCAVRPIERVYLWGRNREKAQSLAQSIADSLTSPLTLSSQVAIEVVESIDETISAVDIVSSATLSQTPLVHGELLRPGQHVDLVGAYKPHGRESDDRAIERSRVFIDTPGGMRESGDIAIPLESGVLAESDIQGNLIELCHGANAGRKTEDEITLFKSVGFALEDLVAAGMVWDAHLE